MRGKEFERGRRRIRKDETNWRESSVAEAGSRGPMAGGELGVWKGKENEEKEDKNNGESPLLPKQAT